MSPEAKTVTIMWFCISAILLISFGLFVVVRNTRDHLKQNETNARIATSITHMDQMNNAIRSDIHVLLAGGEAVEELKDHTYYFLESYNKALYLSRNADPALRNEIKQTGEEVKNYLRASVALLEDSRAEVDLASIMPAAGADTVAVETSQAAFFRHYAAMNDKLKRLMSENSQMANRLRDTERNAISTLGYSVTGLMALLFLVGLALSGREFFRESFAPKN